MGLDVTSRDAHFVDIYERHYRAVYAYCRRRVSADRVDDVVAETFLTVWKKIDRVPAGEEVVRWLYGVAYRVLMHQWRGASRFRRLEGQLISLGVDTPRMPEEYIVSSYESAKVLEAASRLSSTDREILRLSLWEEVAHHDVAAILGLKEAAVRQRLSRALKNLSREFNRMQTKPTSTPAVQKGGG